MYWKNSNRFPGSGFKKIFSITSLVFLVLVCINFLPATLVTAANAPSIIVNNTKLNTEAFFEQGNLMVPLRVFSEKLGMKVDWFESNISGNAFQFVQIQSPVSTILLSPGQDKAVVLEHKLERLKYEMVTLQDCYTSIDKKINLFGESFEEHDYQTSKSCKMRRSYWQFTTTKMPLSAVIYDGKIYVPMRFLSEIAGLKLNYKEDANEVTISGSAVFNQKTLFESLYRSIHKDQELQIHSSSFHMYMTVDDLSTFYEQQVSEGIYQLFLSSFEGKNYYYVNKYKTPIFNENNEQIELKQPEQRSLTEEETQLMRAYVRGEIEELPSIDTTNFNTALLIQINEVIYQNLPTEHMIIVSFSTEDGNQYYMKINAPPMFGFLKFKDAFRSLDNPSDDGWPK